MNRPIKDHSTLQLGENTLESLIQAGSFGAEYVEFDVQLTRDHIPVLYHDFRMNELGGEVPVNSLTCKEFLSIHPHLNPSNSWFPKDKIGKSKSLEDVFEAASFNSDSIKGNGIGTIQGPFATLEQAFKRVPITLGFNIEVKYPNKEEAEMDELNNTEMNAFIDAILTVVFDYAKSRSIYFSSFHPDVCLLLHHKQVCIL